MSCKITSFFTICFFFTFWTFMAVHYTYMKTPSYSRGIASTMWNQPVKPWYDASFKL